MENNLVVNFEIQNNELDAEFDLAEIQNFDAEFVIYSEGTTWGNILGTITNQTDLINLIDTKIDIEATARENNDLSLQNGINTLNNDLTAEISNRGTADGILQDNIDTLSGTVSDNYTTLDGKISDNKTAIDNHITDKNNPHEVTKEQIGLGNVDNTSDLNKPISTATQNALNTKVSNTREINGYSLSSDITLTASDVDALPDTTTINDLTTAEQQSALNSGANSTNIGQIATNTANLNSLQTTVTNNYNTLDNRITSEVSNLNSAISTEATNRQNADNNLQSQIDALVVASDVFDIVGTYAELQAYDISTVPVNDIIKVLVDSTHNNAATYYRCVENDNVKSWSYIGAEGAYYTKSEADNRFVEQTTTINGQALSNNITLDASDVGALPDSTVIGNGTLTIQKNGSTIDTFGANDTGNTTVNITVPTDTSDLTNNAGYITGINSTDVTNALGYTPYDNTNPSGYQENIIETIKVNNTAQTVTNKTVNITVPITASDVNALPDTTKYAASMNLSIDDSTYVITAQLKDQNGDNIGTAQTIDLPLESVVVGGSYDSTNKKIILTLKDGSTIEFSVADLVSGLQTEITSNNKLDADLVDDSTSANKFATSSQLSQIATNTSDISTINNTIGNYGNIVTHDKDEFATASQGDLADSAIQPEDLATVATSGNYNDLSNKPTIPTVGNGTLTIQKNGSTIDTFGANDTGNTTVNITVPTDTSDLTNGAGFITGINSTDVTTALGYTPYDNTNPDGYTDNVGTVTSVNSTQPDNNGNVALIPPIAYGTSTTAASTTEKVVSIPEITTLNSGQIIVVSPTKSASVADLTIKLNNFTAYPILYAGNAITTSTDNVVWNANQPSAFIFNGTNWLFLCHGLDSNTTYSTMSVAEGVTGTATSNRSLQAVNLKQIIQGTTLTGLDTTTNTTVVATDDITTGIGKLQAQTDNIKTTIGNIESALNTINSGSSS